MQVMWLFRFWWTAPCCVTLLYICFDCSTIDRKKEKKLRPCSRDIDKARRRSAASPGRVNVIFIPASTHVVAELHDYFKCLVTASNSITCCINAGLHSRLALLWPARGCEPAQPFISSNICALSLTSVCTGLRIHAAVWVSYPQQKQHPVLQLLEHQMMASK